MDEQKALKIKQAALRTIKIVDLLLAGEHVSSIALKAKADRQLVEYYKRTLKNET